MRRLYNTVIFDIDGCLALVPPGRRIDLDKQEECEAIMSANPPSLPLIHLVQVLYPIKTIVLMSARPERYRANTIAWLVTHNVPYHCLMMRAHKQMEEHDHQVKLSMYKYLVSQGHSIQFVVEDRRPVVEMWRKEGILCLQPQDSE